MAKSKKIDETGMSNDTRSIYMERTGNNSSQWVVDQENDYYENDYYNVSPEEVQPKNDHLTHTIELPEHLRRLYNA